MPRKLKKVEKKLKVVSMPAPGFQPPDLEDHLFAIPEAFAASALNGLIAGMSEEDKDAPFGDIREALVKESWVLSDLMTAEARKRYMAPPKADDAQLPLPLDAQGVGRTAGAPRVEG